MKAFILAILTTTLFTSINAANAASGKWQCTPLTTFFCSVIACNDIPPEGWVEVDFDTNTYGLCGEKAPCVIYEMKSEPSGYMVNAFVTAIEPLLFRMTISGDVYFEVASIGAATHQNFGSCKEL